MELAEVKKILISILNLEPGGIYVDKIDGEFQKIGGCRIPYSTFGYHNLLSFLKNELNNDIRMDDSNSWNMKLYPIPNDKSGHIVKLKTNENDRERSRRYRNW